MEIYKLIKYPALVSVMLLLMVHPSTAGGGWTHKPWHGYIKLGQSLLRSDKFFNPDGSKADFTTITMYSTSLYAEVGIFDRLNVNLYFPFFTRVTLNKLVYPNGDVREPGDELDGIGDSDVTLKFGILRNTPIVLAVSLTLGLPLGDSSGGESGILQTGDGEFNQMISADASVSLGKLYVSTMLGYNNRTTPDSGSTPYSDEFRYSFEAGYNVWKLYLILRGQGVKPTGDDKGSGDSETTGVFGDRLEFMALSPEVVFNITPKFGATVSGSFPLKGKRILASPNYAAGVFITI